MPGCYCMGHRWSACHSPGAGDGRSCCLVPSLLQPSPLVGVRDTSAHPGAHSCDMHHRKPHSPQTEQRTTLCAPAHPGFLSCPVFTDCKNSPIAAKQCPPPQRKVLCLWLLKTLQASAPWSPGSSWDARTNSTPILHPGVRSLPMHGLATKATHL